MIEYLYANGCSWTHGNGIHEDKVFNGNGSNPEKDFGGYRHYKFAWPDQLGNLLKCKVNNDAWGAGSNARMVRRTCEFLETYPKSQIDKLLVIIGWSTLERDEIFVEDYDRWVNYNAAQPFSSQFSPANLTPEQKELNRKIDRTQKQYVTWIHNNRSDIDKYFMQLYLMKNMLENMKVKYIFFNALPWSWIPLDELKEHMPRFEKFKSPYIIGPGTNETMVSFCHDNNLPLSSCIHPMVEGHKQWAGRLYDQLKLVMPEDLK